MINPSVINLLALPSVPLEKRSQLPSKPCVYFVMQDDKVLYIGMTRRLVKRWSRSHHVYQKLKGIKGIHIAWVEISDHQLLFDTEQALIAYFKPPLNHAPIQVRHIPFEKNLRVTVNISRFWREGMTVAQVAKDLDMNTRSITALRKGTEKGDWATLVKLSRYFQVSIDDLLEIDLEDTKSDHSKAIAS